MAMIAVLNFFGRGWEIGLKEKEGMKKGELKRESLA
jgi:hypothetical protein